MAEIWFYHLEQSALEAALPPLLEKCLARGWRALVRGGQPERLEALDDLLWTWRDDSFLPHLAAARARGIEPRIVHLPRIALDIDTPDDLLELHATASGTPAHALLAQWDIHGAAKLDAAT